MDLPGVRLRGAAQQAVGAPGAARHERGEDERVGGRRERVGRLRRRLVRQRPGRCPQPHVQGRADRAPGPWRDSDQVERALVRWVGWYNAERLHSALDYLPPEEFEAEYYRSLATRNGA
ncbi:integrase core domain-containing protein [Streptomyces sp. NPDC055722]